MSELQRLQISRLAELPASVRVTIHADGDGMILTGIHVGGYSGYSASCDAFQALDRIVSKWNEAFYAAVHAETVLKAMGLR